MNGRPGLGQFVGPLLALAQGGDRWCAQPWRRLTAQHLERGGQRSRPGAQRPPSAQDNQAPESGARREREGMAPPLPRRRPSGRWAGRLSLFRGAGPATLRLLPRQVRAACRNASRLTHQRLLPTCRRPIKPSPPLPGARPHGSPPSGPSGSPRPCSPAAERSPARGGRRSARRGRCGLRPGRRRGHGRRAGGQQQVVGPQPARPSRSQGSPGWAPVLGPRREK